MKLRNVFIDVLEIYSGFQLAQLVKFLLVEQETWVQIPPTPKINWCLGLMVRATIMSERYRFKFYHNYQKKKKVGKPRFLRFSYNLLTSLCILGNFRETTQVLFFKAVEFFIL